MKIRFLKLTSIICLFLVLNNCTNNKELKKLRNEININNLEINSLKEGLSNLNIEVTDFDLSSESETNLLNYDFCKDTIAVIEEKSWYDTRYGIAYFEIPIPKGAKLMRIKKTPTSIHYVCTGSVYNDKVKLRKKFVRGLSKKESGRLNIYVSFQLFDSDECSNNGKSAFLTEKKKHSTVGGHPFIDIKN